MTILTKPLAWAYALSPFTQPLKYLVLHHEAGNGTVEQIHTYHRSLGWAGIAYHLYVRKDGSVYAGRPMDRQGGHCKGYNGISIGVCFEGNFENDRMTEAQKAAGAEAVEYVLGMYPQLKVVGHRELVATACPGAHFPLEFFKTIPAAGGDGDKEEEMTGKDILDKLTDEQAWQLVEKAQRHAATLPPSDYAREACKKGVDSGLFSDGNRDGLVDYPQAYLKRQELAAVLDRWGLLEG